MTRAPISCRELVELVTDYVEGTLPRSERKRFQAHLGQCDGCTTYVEQMRMTIEAAGRFTEDSIEPAARDALLAAFRDWKRTRLPGVS